jgi:virginiamycin B lyase
MRLRNCLVFFAGSVVGLICCYPVTLAPAQSSLGSPLSGVISSQQEGVMEGVLVGARKEGSTITVFVISDAKGRYDFPPGRLSPGRYSLRIRAVGYDLQSPALVNVPGGKTTRTDLKLIKARDLSSQLSNAEWLMSMPGGNEWKADLYLCASCHTLEPIVRSHHDAAEWVQVMARMSSYYVGSTPLKPQKRPAPTPEELALPDQARRQTGGGANANMAGEGSTPQNRKLAEYLATINLNKSSTWEYPLKTLPRPKGRETHAIITAYELLRNDSMVHDAQHGPDGMIWYGDFGSQFIGKLDPQTGKVVEYPVPVLKPTYPAGMLDVRIGSDGILWLANMAQGGIARFDTRTAMFQSYSIPPEVNGNNSQVAQVAPYSSKVDGKVWMNSVGSGSLERLDIGSGQMETIYPDKGRFGLYGIGTDTANNLYGNVIGGSAIQRIDAKTRQVMTYPTPTPNSGPRRGHVDSQSRWWFAESRVDNIALFDPKTERIQEWPASTPFTEIYDVIPDKYGDVWTGGRTSDRIYRLDPKTGSMAAYLLPNKTNIRRVDVDSSTTPPVFWVGDDHSPTIYRLEPLD